MSFRRNLFSSQHHAQPEKDASMTSYLEAHTEICHSEGMSRQRDTHDDENVAQTSCLQLLLVQAGSPMSLTFGQWILAACK
jgi:hypothetical protein